VPLTCQTLTRRACALFVAVALVVVAAPVTAIAATPVTMLLVDGGAWVPGTWYNPEPAVTLSSSENGVAFWSWNGGAVQSAAISAGTPLEVGPVPAQGESYLRFRTVNADGEEPTASASVRADWTEPSRPDSLEATIAPMEGGIDLAWTASTDPTPGSGVAHYVVYRHQGPDDPSWIPSPADKVAEPTDAFYRDLPPANEDFYTYVVEAHDAAGNESFLSLSASAFWQSGPPTDPTDVYAWLNAAGDVRLLWGASTDLGSGLASYEVSRSVEGGPWEVRANPVAADTVWVDVLPGATVLEYGIRALDRVGFGSNAVTVTAGVDTTGPVLGALTATPAYAPPGSGSYFDVDWTALTDPVSGVESVALDYGPVGGPSSRATSTGPGALRVGSPAESAYYEFLLTASDRAGNVTTYPASARHVTVDRLTVGDPVYASIEWSRRTFGSAGTVVLVGAGRYWDALAASSLAGRVGGPVLMVGRTLDGATAAEIRRLGARRAYLIGGTGGVSRSVQKSVRSIIRRTPKRYTTSLQIAREVRRLSRNRLGRVYLVSGTDPRAAMTVAPLAFAECTPIIYGTSAGVTSATRSALRSMRVRETFIVGGGDLIGWSAEARVPAPVRLTSSSAMTISQAFVDWSVGAGLMGAGRPYLTADGALADAASFAQYAGAQRRSVIVTSAGPWDYGDASAWLGARRAGLGRVTIVAPEWVLGPDVVSSVRAAVCRP
jgi:hypothetical protein